MELSEWVLSFVTFRDEEGLGPVCKAMVGRGTFKVDKVLT